MFGRSLEDVASDPLCFFFADVSHRVSTTAKQVDIFTSCVEKRVERELGQSNVAASLVTG